MRPAGNTNGNPHPGAKKIARQPGKPVKESTMLKWALIFGIISLIAAGLGFGGIAGAAAGIAKVLFFVFLAICLILIIAGVFIGKKLT
jgi:uncharacterized membrane protein YtjA (UPF0391 family)